jgi:hypothetical protein
LTEKASSPRSCSAALAFRYRPSRGLAIAVVLVGALAGASRVHADTPASPVPLTIPDLPHDDSRFGLLIVGEPDGIAIAARAVVRRALENDGHPVEVISGLEAVPRREDVLRICAQNKLDGLAFVVVRRGHVPALADVGVRDANGDPFEGEAVPDRLGGDEPSRVHWTAPLFTASKATFNVPASEEPEVAEPRPAPLGPLPPLLWFDERNGSALLGERLLADGEVYRLLGRPDLELSFQSRMRTKNTLLATGIAASSTGLLLGLVLSMVEGHRPTLGWPSSDKEANFFFVDGAVLAGGIAALAVAWSIDPHPMARHERFERARDFNAARLHDDDPDDPDDPEP